jgi:hypothetical protein
MDKTCCVLSVEDELSGLIGERLLRNAGIANVIPGPRNKGFGQLKSRISNLNRTAKSIPVMVITDLDRVSCPVELIKHWLPQRKNEGLLFRVAVVEIESWVMADQKSIAAYLNVAKSHFPQYPDEISNPKEHLLNIIRKFANRSFKKALLPKPGSSAPFGPEYNSILGQFVLQNWSIQDACKASPSLARTINALFRFLSK